MEYNKSTEELIKELNSDLNGLSKEEVKIRLEKNGKNILPTKKRDSILKIFFKELTSPIEIVLLITVIISFIIGEREGKSQFGSFSILSSFRLGIPTLLLNLLIDKSKSPWVRDPNSAFASA